VPLTSPRTEYDDRIAARLDEAATALAGERRMEHARLTAAGLFVAAMILRGALPVGALVTAATLVGGLSVAAFVGAVFYHRRRRRARIECETGAKFYRQRLARMDMKFAGRGDDGSRFLPPEHPYARHLDIFGNGSVFELLSNSVSESGRATLATWLLDPAAPDAIAARQAAIKRLAPELDLRERRALELARGDGEPAIYGPEELEGLAGWAEALPAFAFPEEQVIAVLLTGVTITVLTGVALFGLPAGWFVGALIAQILYWVRIRPEIARAMLDLELATRELLHVGRVLSLAAGDEPGSDAARAVLADSASAAPPIDPEAVVEALRTPYRLMLRSEWMGNMFFWALGATVMWGTHHAMLIERWRARWGASIREWIRIAGGLEALLDLSAQAFEHPDDAFPTVDASRSGFSARAMCHPLLAEGAAVRNDVVLDYAAGSAILSVTGANMSGKSTLLRSTGVNAVLAQAGAPVRAIGLEMGATRIAASIRNVDSLVDATSHFYAELKAIRGIVDTAREGEGLLFLMDEVMGGTDSGDREVGVVALIGGLLESGAVGIVTTHDRSLARRLGEEYPEQVRNVHLEWEWEEGELRFPFALLDGLNPSTNAIELMRSLGLEVDRPE